MQKRLNIMDKFEKLIKTSVESYEAPYSKDAWDALSKKLGPEKGASTKWYIGGAVLAASIVLGIWYLYPSTGLISSAHSKDIVINDIDTPKTNTNNNTSQIKSTNITNLDISTDIKDKVNTTKTANQIKDNSSTSDHLDERDNSEDLFNDHPSYSNIAPITSNRIEQKEEDIFDTNIEIIEPKIDFSVFNLSVIANKNEVCLGQSISLSPSIPKIKAEYQWVLGNGDIVNGPYLDYTFEQAGNYNVSVQLIDPKSEKIVNKSEPVLITVNPSPANEINYEFNDNAFLPRANFTQKNLYVKHIAWEIKGIHKSAEKSFSYDFKHKGSYIVTCQLTDNNGCQSASNIIVPIENDYNLLAPSAFTPNGDNLNETFIPKALLVINTPFIMTIYDKSGKLVFETNDSSRPWDGLYKKDFLPAPTGSYVWVVQLTNEQKQVETYQGQVTITR